MARPNDARQKALATAERLFRSQGYAATGLAQIINESGSPKGSFYFHFPGGKDQLAAETIAAFKEQGLALIAQVAAETPGDPSRFVALLCATFAAEMRTSAYALGCVLQNIASEKAPVDPVLTPILADGLSAWVAAVARHFASCGVSGSNDVALALVAALEGARTLARSTSSDTVFDAVSATLSAGLSRTPD
jgi:TetR/AcrR family transcriptional regulator, lmrAB and yxaGH operons repressor